MVFASVHADWVGVTVTLLTAAAHLAGTRLLVALAVFVVYLGILPRPAPRPLAVAALCVLVVVWTFGATLIWGTA